MVTSHRGEDGVRGVEAAGGVGAAEAPVRPPVQHLYSAVQCTPVQYSTAQHQPQHPAAGRHHGHGRRLPPGAPPVTSEGQVRGALVSRGLQFSYRCTCTMIFTILGESAYCRVSTCPLNEFLIFAYWPNSSKVQKSGGALKDSENLPSPRAGAGRRGRPCR